MKAGRFPIITVAAILSLLVAPGSLWPWAGLAHRSSSNLADSFLTAAAKAAIRDLLEPVETLADASTRTRLRSGGDRPYSVHPL